MVVLRNRFMRKTGCAPCAWAICGFIGAMIKRRVPVVGER